MPQPGADGVTDAACWNSDVGPCHHGGGPAIFWPCSPERTGQPVERGRSPRRPPGASRVEDSFPLLRPPAAAVLEEDTRKQISAIARKIEVLSLRVDTCLSGITDLQTTFAGFPDRLNYHLWESAASRGSTDRSAEPSHRAEGSKSPSHKKALLEALANEASGSAMHSELEERFGVGPRVQATMNHVCTQVDAECESESVAYISSALEASATYRWSSRYLRPPRGRKAEAIWKFLEEPDSSRAARYYSTLWVPFIFATVVVTLLQSVKPCPLQGLAAGITELCFDTIFMVEALVRFSVSPSFLVFLKSPYNVMDLLAAIPFGFRLAVGLDSTPAPGEIAVDTAAEVSLAIVCLAPCFRVLKTLRRFQQMHLFLAVIYYINEALKFLLLSLVIMILVFSSLLFLVESRTNIETLPKAMWLTIVTMTTVGYGDVTPKTNAGHAIVTILLVGSVLLMAMPVGIIGNAFTEMWKDRHRILLNHRFQDHILQSGYTVRDVVGMFMSFDTNRDGVLNLGEFVDMIKTFGIEEEKAVQLFESIDKDGSGGIDSQEFIREFFPSRYREVYSKIPEEAKEAKESSTNVRRPSRESRRSSRSPRKRRGCASLDRSTDESLDVHLQRPAPAQESADRPKSPGSTWRNHVEDGLALQGRGEAGTGGVPPDSLLPPDGH